MVGVATLEWGETPKCDKTLQIVTKGSGTCSLTGLEPGKTYYFKIAQVVADDPTEQEIFGTATLNQKPITFTTSTKAVAAKTYHVAEGGDDSRDGQSEATAFTTISHPADLTRPGDTVLVGSGTYAETVRMRNTGEKDRTITIKAAPGARVTLDGIDGQLQSGFVIQGKSYINIDGFYTTNFQGWGNVYILYSSHINVSRNFIDGRGRYIPTQAIGIYNSEHVIVSNCVFVSAYRGTRINVCSNVIFRNNVFLRNLICCVIVRTPQGPTYLTHNIFMDGTPQKAKKYGCSKCLAIRCIARKKTSTPCACLTK